MFLLMNALILSFFWFLCGNIIHIFFFNFFLLFVITQTWLYLDLSNATACNFFMKVFFLDLISVNILCLVEYIIFYRRLSDWRVIQVPMSLKLAEEWTCESTPYRLTTSFFLKKIKMIKERDIDVYICGGLLNFWNDSFWWEPNLCLLWISSILVVMLVIF